jgi:hypothetical protein
MIQLADVIGNLMSTRTKAGVARKQKACKCLVCDAMAARGHRGLCKTHYFQFNHAWRKRKTVKARSEFELEQIRKGHVLASIRGQHQKPNIFEE